MATSSYTQNFSLADIFNNKKLREKLPLLNYKETEKEDGKISYRTNAKTVTRLVFDTAEKSARPFFKPLKSHRNGNRIEIDGNLVADYDVAYNGIYAGLVAAKQLISYTANNRDILMSAIKETGKNKRMFGLDSKLYLRAKSMQEIEGMTKRQLQAFMQDIMSNIFFGDDFPKTQEKFGLYDRDFGDGKTYAQHEAIWKKRIGQ